MRTDELDFDLPAELIAQQPADARADARLLTYDRVKRQAAHRHVRDLPALLRRGDLLVFNDTAVAPARFAVRKPTGGVVDGLRLGVLGDGAWQVLLRGLGPVRPADCLRFAGHPSATLRVTNKLAEGYRAEVGDAGDPEDVLRVCGRMPLPPYIKRLKMRDPRDDHDRDRYQTVFNAGQPRSVAAPTAGLHFDPPLLAALREAGVSTTTVTLEVGPGTFKPVTADDLAGHEMHRERWHISDDAANHINAAKREGRRVIPVGTTALRTLESQPPGDLAAGSGETDLFITPGYEPKHASGLMTNFHLPRSTLIALVDALVGTPERRDLYALAIRERYRFFSYGDAMLIV